MDALRADAAAAKVSRDYGGQGAPNITLKVHQFESGVAMLYENNERSKRLKETLRLEMTNLELVNGSGSVVDVDVRPGGEQLVVVRTSGPGGFSFGYRTSSRVMTV